jgi:hypothetical protein
LTALFWAEFLSDREIGQASDERNLADSSIVRSVFIKARSETGEGLEGIKAVFHQVAGCFGLWAANYLELIQAAFTADLTAGLAHPALATKPRKGLLLTAYRLVKFHKKALRHYLLHFHRLVLVYHNATGQTPRTERGGDCGSATP